MSMYRWYQRAEKCYVYLPDVTMGQCAANGEDSQQRSWESSFRVSRWFARGWTLQELLAPPIVEFYSREGALIGTKKSLAQQIHGITSIPLAALYGTSPSQYPIAERLRWTENRHTKKPEDRAYCLLGLFDVFMPLIYGEGDNAFRRLEKEIQARSESRIRPASPMPKGFSGIYAHAGLQPVASYVSRPDLEQKLRHQLLPESAIADDETRTAVVWGLGGTGKSQLVLYFVRQQQHHYRNIFWVAAGQKQTVERDYLAIHRLLFPEAYAGSEGPSLDSAIVAVKSWLQQQKARSLWVMDSADTVDDEDDPGHIDLHYYLPDAPRLDRIVSTRSASVQDLSSAEDSINVTEMHEREAIALFHKCAKLRQSVQDAEAEIAAIVQELGYLALAVNLAGAYVKETPRLTGNIRLYLPEYRAHRKRLLSRRPRSTVHRYSTSVLNTWEMSLAGAKRRMPLAARLLSLLACLHFDDIFLGLFPLTASPSESHSGPAEEEQISWVKLLSSGGDMLDSFTIEEAFGTLKAYSLLSWRPDQEAYGMHNPVHAWGQDRLEMGQRLRWSLAGLNLLSQVIDLYKDNLNMSLRLVSHAMANLSALQNAIGITHQVTAQARICLTTVVALLRRLGQWDNQYKVQSFLRSSTEVALGREHPETLKGMYDLAVVDANLGNYIKAHGLLKETLQLQKMVLGEQHRDTLLTMSELADATNEQGEFKAAEDLFRQTVELQQMVMGAQHRDTLASSGGLAYALRRQGRYEEAEQLMREVLEIQKTVLGERDEDVWVTMNDLALVLTDRGRYSDAESMYRQQLERSLKERGERHPRKLTTMCNLSLAISNQG